MHAGGKNFSHIPCLNDSDDGMAVIETMVRRELSGWVCLQSAEPRHNGALSRVIAGFPA